MSTSSRFFSGSTSPSNAMTTKRKERESFLCCECAFRSDDVERYKAHLGDECAQRRAAV